MAVQSAFKTLGGKIFAELDPDDELEYAFDMTAWCAARNVNVESYTLHAPAGSALEIIEDTRNANVIYVLVRLPIPSARPVNDFVDGVTCRAVTSNAPGTNLPLTVDHTMWFCGKSH